MDPSLTGTGVNVAQAEPPENVEGTAWQVNPSSVGQPTNLFTYLSSSGTASNYPNAIGLESTHADWVGANFYGIPNGTAPGVAHVDNYEAGHFYQSKIVLGGTIQAKIVNQSFIFGATPPQRTVDQLYDNSAAQNNVLFVSGVGNFGSPGAPSTSYNGIGVGVSDGSTSIGPTSDNGRSKPDITAPGGATSFSTPFVAGAAAILRQAGLRGDGGVQTSAAADIRTVKALLLNGAIKPSNWTHTATAPLDTRFGAGVLNAFNSYKQLNAGKFSFVESTGHSAGGPHPPAGNTNNVDSLVGWDFASITSSISQDRVNHYYFNLPSNAAKTFTVTATLVWNRQVAQTNINNLDLLLYDCRNSNIVVASSSTVDNVEHIYIPNLPSGRYDLQVFKKGGLGNVSFAENYALAFEIFSMSLNVARSGTNIVISWPIAPTGFRLESAPSLNHPIDWTSVAITPIVTNNQNVVALTADSSAQFFRLVRPD